MIENFNYSRSCSLLASPEPPSDFVPIPIPVFRPAVRIEDHGPAPVEVAIFQELAEIKREVRAIRVRDSAQNALAVPLESAMAMLGCKRSQIFKLLEQRRLARASKVGRAVMITVASIEALLAAGAPQKCSTRSRTPKNQPESINKRCRARRGKKPIGGAEQDPGKSIRNLVI